MQEKSNRINIKLKKNTLYLKKQTQKLSGLQQDLNLKTSQLHSLDELNQKLEGFADGVRHLIKAKDKIGGIHQVVGRLIKTEARYERAIEAALAHCLGYVVVEDLNSALKGISYLNENKSGRVSFILKNKITPAKDISTGLQSINGVLGGALEFVEPAAGAAEYTDTITYLFSDVLLVEDLSTIQELILKNKADIADYTIVGLTGEVLKDGIIISGGGTKGAGGGILTRNRRIEELQEQIKTLKSEHEKLSRHIKKRRSHIDKLNELQTEQQYKLRNIELDLLTQKKDAEQHQRELSRIEYQLNTIEAECSQLKLEQQEAQDTLADKKEELGGIKDDEEAQQSLIEQIKQEVSDVNQILQALRGEVTQYRIDIASLQEKTKTAGTEIRRLENSIRNLNRRLGERRLSLEKDESRKLQTKAELAEKNKLLLKEAKENNKLKQIIIEKNRLYEDKRLTASQLETDYRQQKKNLEKLAKQTTETEIQITKINLRINQLAEQINIDNPLIMPSTQEEEGDVQTWTNELALAEKRLAAIGNVNLTAIEEYNLLEERYQFYVKQLNDLTESVESLQRVIAQINSTTKERFKKTLDAVNEQFGKVYTRLFEGGRAELRLDEGSNILNGGVEIMVQPPCKKLQNLNLLSGGEKALTAIAFLFSIYLIKPSPLCFLDEVDAALDEANVGRLIIMLKEFTKQSQIIIITHNKRTMETADLLYGITMETPGASKIVSVKFN